MQAFESEARDVPDFYFTGDDYRYRFEPEAKERFIDLIRERFNSGVKYKGRVLKWYTIIEQKASELGGFLTGKSPTLDFVEPRPRLDRHDGEVRAKILGLTGSQAKELGIGKSTLHYLRRNAANKRELRVYAPIRVRLMAK